MSAQKSNVLIVYNEKTIDPKIIQSTKMHFYAAGMRVCVLWNKTSQDLKKAVEKLCSEEANKMDIILIIISTCISTYRSFQTSDMKLDLYKDLLHPIMKAKDSKINKICVMNGAFGEIESNKINEPDEPDENQDEFKSSGQNTYIVISDETNFIKEFIPIIFEYNGDIGKAVDQYQEKFSTKTYISTTNPKLLLKLVPRDEKHEIEKLTKK